MSTMPDPNRVPATAPLLEPFGDLGDARAVAAQIRRDAADVLGALGRMEPRLRAGRRPSLAEIEAVTGRLAVLQDRIERAGRRDPAATPDIRAARRSIHRALLVADELLRMA